MAIGNLEVIQVGLPNESTGSDSLYLAFSKSKNNFATLANYASQYVTFTGNIGVSVTSNSIAGSVDILNTGVTNLLAGPGISLDSSNGNVTITNTGGSNSNSGVTSVGLTSSTLAVSNSPITSAGAMVVNLQTIAPAPTGTFTNPQVTVDQFGRITAIANGTSGTVTSVAVTPGTGIQVTGSPVTTSGTINIVNTGVTRLSAGTGISVSGSNGAVTISTTTTGGTVTGVTVASNALVITGSPITTSGTITVDLPSNISVTGSTTIGTFMRLTPGTAPSSPVAGMVYYDSGSNTLKCYNGSAWKTITMV